MESASKKMEQLVTPEGIAKLVSQIEPIKAAGGMLPHKDGSRTTDSVDAKPVGDRPAVAIEKKWQGLEGRFVMFTLGPVYYTLGVPFDLVEQFRNSDYGSEAVIHRLRYPTTVLPDVPGWESMVEAVDAASWDKLELFLAECVFSHGTNYWSICGDKCVIPAPNTLNGSKVPLAVFTPRGHTMRMRPVVDNIGKIRLYKEDVTSPVVLDNFHRKLNLVLDGDIR